MLSAIQSVAASRTAASARWKSRLISSRVGKRMSRIAAMRCAHEETQPLAFGAEEGVNGHVVRDLVRAQARRERRHECCPGQRDATTRIITGARPRGSIRQPVTIRAQCILAPHRGNLRVADGIRRQQPSDAHDSERSCRSRRWPSGMWRVERRRPDVRRGADGRAIGHAIRSDTPGRSALAQAAAEPLAVRVDHRRGSRRPRPHLGRPPRRRLPERRGPR